MIPNRIVFMSNQTLRMISNILPNYGVEVIDSLETETETETDGE